MTSFIYIDTNVASSNLFILRPDQWRHTDVLQRGAHTHIQGLQFLILKKETSILEFLKA